MAVRHPDRTDRHLREGVMDKFRIRRSKTTAGFVIRAEENFIERILSSNAGRNHEKGC